MTQSANQRNAAAKKVFKTFYNIPDGVDPKTRRNHLNTALEAYQGLNLATELESFCKFFKINIEIYTTNPRKTTTDRIKFNQYLSMKIDKPTETVHLVQFPLLDGRQHVARIEDLELLKNDFLICPHCHDAVFDKAYDRKHRNKSRFEKHVEKCKANGGKHVKELKLAPYQTPYIPLFTKQPIYELLYAHEVPHLFTPNKSFITYDFETVEDRSHTKSTDKTSISAELIPTVVSSTVCNCGEQKTTHSFNPQEDSDFIKAWIRRLFVDAQVLAEDRYNQYFNNPEFMTLYNTLTEKQQKHIRKLILQETSQVAIIGFNSAKFDSNLILPYLCSDEWRITAMIGSTANHKSITVSSLNTEVKVTLKFIDIRCYIAGGTLDGFTREFGSRTERTKGFFPYEAITLENWVSELSESNPFPQESFYSSLSNSNISDDDYQIYLQEASQFSTRMEYFIHYCNLDTQIMIEPILNLIDLNFIDKVDMLHNASLSANASMIKYAKPYDAFNINEEVTLYPKNNTYTLTLEEFTKQCTYYKAQDERAKRPTQDNISPADFRYFRDQLKTCHCALCSESFHKYNPPSFDRIDNSLPHKKANLQLTCRYCNKYKSDNDEAVTKLRLRLRKYAIKNSLPMALGKADEQAYHIIRKGITGGLSNVQHRVNIKGKTRINKLKYNISDHLVYDEDTEHIVTHCLGLDFNSLYPSLFAAIEHDFVKLLGTKFGDSVDSSSTRGNGEDSKMWMPGRILKTIECNTPELKQQARTIIDNRNSLFIAVVKGHIPENRIPDCINYPPIFRNIDISIDEETIGEYMFKYFTDTKQKTGHKERKLTQLMSTHGEFMSFSSYYLWFLITEFDFVIDDIETIITFNKTDCFSIFANEFMNRRQEAELQGNKGKGLFCKINMNGSYGYDAMNTEKYSTTRIVDSKRAQGYINSAQYRDVTHLGDDVELVTLDNNFYRCKTPIHEAYFTLDNAKVWYLMFIYKFMNRCLDMERIHFIEGDTDSIYIAVAGDPSLGREQGLQAVIKDHDFYNEHIFKFAPYDFYCSDESKRPTCDTPRLRKAHEKKLMGLAVEKTFDSMVALCPKCYTGWLEDESTGVITVKATKCKGINIRQNPLKHTDYCDIIFKGGVKDGTNTGIRTVGGFEVKYTVHKSALTGKHVKGITQANGCVHPFVCTDVLE